MWSSSADVAIENIRIHLWPVICFLCICRPYTLSVTQGSRDVRLLRWLHDWCLQWQLLGGKMFKILSHYPLLNPRSRFCYSECLFWKLLWWDDIYISAGAGETSGRNPVDIKTAINYESSFFLTICFLCCSLSGWKLQANSETGRRWQPTLQWSHELSSWAGTHWKVLCTAALRMGEALATTHRKR